MSRVGQAIINIPNGVEVKKVDNKFLVKGSKGELSAPIDNIVNVTINEKEIKVELKDKDNKNRALWGTTRALVANIVKGVTRFNFIDDSSTMMTDEGDFKRNGNLGDERNTEKSYTRISGHEIVNTQCNDVSMTVQPNAPTDVITGLPVPTIVVATDGGISVITNDGTTEGTTVYDLTTNNEASSVAEIAFLADNRYSFATKADNSRWWVDDIQTADENHNYFYQRTSYDYSSGGQGSLNPLGRVNGTSRGEHGEAIFRQASGMSRIRYVDTLLNYTTTDYNTGWMGGEVKGAYLSSTDDTNLSGTSLIANGDFSSSSTAAFTTVAGGTAAVVSGLLKLTDTGGAFCYASAPFTTVVGNQYFITADIVNSSNTANANYIRCGNSHNGIDFHNTNYGTGYGTKTFYFTATATTTYLTLISGNGVGEIGHWDNVFVYKLDNDRSVSSKGLQPYGTITKSAVATGAELVAYSGWSSSNYLRQPYNSNLDFGSDDWSFNFWVNPNDSSSGSVLISRWSYNVDSSLAGRIGIYFNSGNVRFDLTDDGASSYQGITGTNGIQDTTGWHMVNILRRGDNAEMWVDGKLDVSAALTSTSNGSYSNSNAILEIGHSPNMGSPDSGIQLALIRISASVPSAEQIKKMYNDEKCLFHENAKCTLYGTSDAVTALAHDDSNNILHVGTSAGRSEFQGLNRINNTTTAVTTAISASNELIAEQ